MKIILRTTLTLAAFSILSMTISTEAAANEYTCTIKSGRQNVYVVVTDMDRDGNPMRQRGELFQGVMKAHESQTLNSTFGKLRYSYRLYNQSRSQGRIAADCRGNTIQLP